MTRVVVLIALVVLGYYGLLFAVQRSLLFPAPRGPVRLPTAPGNWEVHIPASGDTVLAWYGAPSAGSGARFPVIVFTHGNAERAEDWVGQFRDLQARGIGVVIVEYPGYGVAPGKPSEESITAAVLAAYDWVRAQPFADTARIIAWGRSLGGGAATRLATRRPVAALILESSFRSIREFAKRYWAPGFLVRDPFDNLTELKAYHGPLLVLHGEHDEVAPLAGGRSLAAAVPGATFVAIPCGHNDCERPTAVVTSFLAGRGILHSPVSHPGSLRGAQSIK